MRIRFDRPNNCICVDTTDLTSNKDFQEVADVVQHIHKSKFEGELDFTAASVAAICAEANGLSCVALKVSKERVAWKFKSGK